MAEHFRPLHQLAVVAELEKFFAADELIAFFVTRAGISRRDRGRESEFVIRFHQPLDESGLPRTRRGGDDEDKAHGKDGWEAGPASGASRQQRPRHAEPGGSGPIAYRKLFQILSLLMYLLDLGTHAQADFGNGQPG